MTAGARAALTIVAMLLIAGCARLGFTEGSSTRTEVDGRAPDGRAPDGPAPFDVGYINDVHNSAVEGPHPPDLGDSDLLADQAPPTPDTSVWPTDQALVPLDQAIISAACGKTAQPGTAVPGWAPGKIQICTSQMFPTQCTAASLCNKQGGWHLCTATEYRTLGGATAGAGVKAWIQGCIRDGSTVTAPTDLACTDCATGASGTAEDVAWFCSTGGWFTSNNMLHLGIVTDSSCFRLGANSVSTAAYWRHHAASVGVNAAVCCHP